MTDDLYRLEGASSSATLDRGAQTLVFEHFGSVTTAEQKSLSPLVIPLGEIASVEIRCGRSTNWFWVVRRGHQAPRGGAPSDPCGVVSGADPSDFAERVRAAVARVAPVEAPELAPVPKKTSGWGAKLARGVVDGFFNTR